jgi:hypothetical protein
MACNESKRVNVGDPDRSQKERVLRNKSQKQEPRKVYWEVRCVVVLRTWESQVQGEGRWVSKLLVEATSWSSQKTRY